MSCSKDLQVYVQTNLWPDIKDLIFPFLRIYDPKWIGSLNPFLFIISRGDKFRFFISTIKHSSNLNNSCCDNTFYYLDIR